MAKVSELATSTDTDEQNSYPHLKQVSEEYGVSADALVRTFKLERAFHGEILATESASERSRQYDRLYREVYLLRRENPCGKPREGTPHQYAKLVHTFRRELEGKSVLDVGCGDGLFLYLISRLLAHKDLWGIDTAEVTSEEHARHIHFRKDSVIDFQLDRTFDVVYSHQVLEHIAPADLPTHLRSIHAAIKPGGKFIVILPNRYWGPQDITRIVDNTFTGRVPAIGSHLNESSYTELVPVLESFGFTNIRTVLPLAMFLPPLRRVRVIPILNRLLERHTELRNMTNTIRRNGRPIFKNPVILIGEKSC